MGEEMRFTKRDTRVVTETASRYANNFPERHISDISIRPSPSVEVEVEAILWSARLSLIRRFNWQPYWENESAASDKALQIEDGLPLENVAEHSWKVADMAMFLHHLVPSADRTYCIELALLHDKLELITGDYSPIDEDASGLTTHAFNEESAVAKKESEYIALQKYLLLLPEAARDYQKNILEDAIEMRSDEARFVNALDKLAAVAYIVVKRPRGLRAEHLDFTEKYSRKAVLGCPALLPHHARLLSMLKQLE